MIHESSHYGCTTSPKIELSHLTFGRVNLFWLPSLYKPQNWALALIFGACQPLLATSSLNNLQNRAVALDFRDCWPPLATPTLNMLNMSWNWAQALNFESWIPAMSVFNVYVELLVVYNTPTRPLCHIQCSRRMWSMFKMVWISPLSLPLLFYFVSKSRRDLWCFLETCFRLEKVL